MSRPGTLGWIQLVREWPPGYGGVERVAHELATSWQRRSSNVVCYSLCPPSSSVPSEHLPVTYKRRCLPCVAFGRVLIPLPSRSLVGMLVAKSSLMVHLPCPSLLLLSLVARLCSADRPISLFWHAFLEPEAGPRGWLVAIYQWLALRWAAIGPSCVVTTSPTLVRALMESGVPEQRIRLLPCCLGSEMELEAAAIWSRRQARLSRTRIDPFRLIYIGRLSSYKCVDRLILAFPSSGASELHIVGDGPERLRLERLASGQSQIGAIVFHGMLSESEKLARLEHSDLLVLPSRSCHEAFGIVQLEAMACGVPALGFNNLRSGMAWVAGLEQALRRTGWRSPQHPTDLSSAINQLAEQPEWLREASIAARLRYERVFARCHWERRLLTSEA
ncbi:hypothetical protein SYNGFB01_03675 [Synechococcus sp. GFB01]|nr:hypothetical protein SYNGFB01_03675 [Synechococcus sp. GFB01]